MQLIELGTLDKIKKEIADAPEKTKSRFTKTQALDYLKDELAALLEKNYTLDEIVEFLKKRGLSVSMSTLKTFLKTNFPKDTGRKGRKKAVLKK